MSNIELPRISFTKDLSEYKREIDPINDSIKQYAYFFHIMDGISLNDAKKKVRTIIKKTGMKNPKIEYYLRDEKGDKTLKKGTMYEYIKDSLSRKDNLSPSMIAYRTDNGESLHGEFIQDGLKNRSKKKKEAKEAEAKGNDLLFAINNTLQKYFKLKNNSLSGAYLSSGTILSNPTAHTALTSSTRMAASIGNALSEMIIGGFRHYRTPETIMNHFLALVSNVDMNKVKRTIDKFELKYPDVDDVMDMIDYNIGYYWRDDEAYNKIKSFINKLSPVQRASLLYVNDLYHLYKLNKEKISIMIKRMAKKQEGISSDLNVLKQTDEFMMNIVHHILMDELKGCGLNYEAYNKPLKDLLVSTTINLVKETHNYFDIFDTFFRTNVLPIDVVHMKDMVRRTIALSDTDSTCSSYMNWIYEITGEVDFSPKNVGIAAVVLMFNSASLEHYLTEFASNLTSDKTKYGFLSMKNEFFFPTFIPMNVSKHYFSDIAIKEGFVYPERKFEIKGVNLIAGKLPKKYKDILENMEHDISDTLNNNKKIKLEEYIKQVISLEEDIMNRLNNRDIEVFIYDGIKDKNSYQLHWTSTPYYYYKFYKNVFEDKYGMPDDLPLVALKINVNLGSKTKIREWLENIKDEEIQKKAKEFLKKHPKDKIDIFRFPLSIMRDKGLPEEFNDILDYKRTVLDILAPFYIILESIGFYKKENHLIKDML